MSMLARTGGQALRTAAAAARPWATARSFATSQPLKMDAAELKRQQQWINNAITQLKYAAAVAQTPPGKEPPAAPKIDNPIKAMMLEEVKAFRKEWESQYDKEFELTETEYNKGVSSFNTEKARLGLKDFDGLKPPGKKTSWKQILEG